MAVSIWRATVLVLLAWIGFELHGLRTGAVESVPEGHPHADMKADSASARVVQPLLRVDDRAGSASPASPAASSRRLTIGPHGNVERGSVGLGAQHLMTTRTHGHPQYGNALFEYLVRAPIDDGQFDVGASFWSTATEMTGGSAALFGAWIGANSPGALQVHGGGATVGLEVNAGNRHGDPGLQSDVGGKRYTVGVQIVPDVVPTADTLTYPVSLSGGTPGVVVWKRHGLLPGTPLRFRGATALPPEVSAAKVYYISADGLTPDSFALAPAPGAAPLAFATSASARAIPSFPGSFAQMIGPSVHAHRWWVGSLLRHDSLMPGGYGMVQAGGARPGVNVPMAWTLLQGHWTNGLDFSAASFDNAALKFGTGQVSTSARAGRGSELPQRVEGYLVVDVNGSPKRIPYFAP